MPFNLAPALTHAAFHLTVLGILPLTGTFPATGTLSLSPRHLAITLTPAGARSPMPGLAARLCTQAWLDCARDPAIRYDADRWTQTAPDHVQVEGQLTLHGQTHKLQLAARITREKGGALAFAAETTISRHAYAIGPATSWLADTIRLDVRGVFVPLP